ncbi:ABC transporter ATP-binding protein [Prevotella pallens]|jgi:ABC transporter, ATP-binding protein, msbA family|uniref:ATP-binding cassette, subfamily B, MsbA n=2 Tax=Prevotella pallens TaxID=60133 RepID=A0ABX9DU52_9BACT|nr:ABC transporter ATP-binding protein [Prevotella pallens]EGQ23325.1 ABC superfamily ATP binding cassette transporter, ABC/membrane protein [Prevotella pallens ATCC 700821]MBF1483698.1 ABC transporter ATP-binding protein [Prevotella pallens]MBF1496776.1 ABC transporter ATP-binding protein [Prevotella pallens]RAS46702.1 ATP-binding cassette, subfamily B, MsbA [Prevotella pallens]
MKEFLQILRRFVPPYKKYLVWSVVFNILSAILNIFSFAALIPLLQILFKVDTGAKATQVMALSDGSLKDVLANNANYYTQLFISDCGPTTTLLIIGLIMGFMTFLKTGAYFLSSASIIPVRTGVVCDIRNQLYQKITSLSLSFFSEERKGDIIARMSGDVQEVDSSVMSSLDLLFKNPILVLIYFITLMFISWQLTIFTLLFVPLFASLMGIVGRKLKQGSITAQALWSDTMSQVEETLGGLRIIKAFCAEAIMNQRFQKVNSMYRNDIMRVNIRQQMAHPMSEFLGTIMIIVVLWFGGTLVLGKYPVISGPTFIYYLVILYSILNPLKEISKAGYSIAKGLASMERIDKILMAESAIKEVEQPKHIDSFNHQIEFRNVSFAYDTMVKENGTTEPKWVLRNINLIIPKGKTIALVGQSGSGKSTLLDLIPRYYDVQEGEILIDGINIKELSIHDLRHLIGNVNQEAILFNDTFKNNITFGVSADNTKVIEAAKIANAHDFISQTEKGYETNIGDRGGRLSGGQRQRVSIARAILKNPPILILDEATSALDTESERLVQDALYKLMKTRTTIAVAHRLSTIKNSDEICVMHEGEIVERGTHEELMLLNGYYKKLHDMQEI